MVAAWLWYCFRWKRYGQKAVEYNTPFVGQFRFQLVQFRIGKKTLLYLPSRCGGGLSVSNSLSFLSLYLSLSLSLYLWSTMSTMSAVCPGGGKALFQALPPVFTQLRRGLSYHQLNVGHMKAPLSSCSTSPNCRKISKALSTVPIWWRACWLSSALCRGYARQAAIYPPFRTIFVQLKRILEYKIPSFISSSSTMESLSKSLLLA